jgi:hypothetical protein
MAAVVELVEVAAPWQFEDGLCHQGEINRTRSNEHFYRIADCGISDAERLRVKRSN